MQYRGEKRYRGGERKENGCGVVGEGMQGVNSVSDVIKEGRRERDGGCVCVCEMGGKWGTRGEERGQKCNQKKKYEHHDRKNRERKIENFVIYIFFLLPYMRKNIVQEQRANERPKKGKLKIQKRRERSRKAIKDKRQREGKREREREPDIHGTDRLPLPTPPHSPQSPTYRTTIKLP